MNLQRLVCAVLLACSAPGDGTEQQLLSRKRRYLMFPQGSNFVITVANPKRLLTNMRPKGWNGLLECDVFWPLPKDTRELLNGPPLWRRRTSLHQRDRRQLYAAITDILHMHDLDGQACLSRILCEAATLLGPAETFLQEVLRTLFMMPGEVSPAGLQYVPAVNSSECLDVSDACPVSVLSVLLAWAQ